MATNHVENNGTEGCTAFLIDSYRRQVESFAEPEEAYRAAVPLEHRKRFGQFFTSLPIAKLMVEWVKATSPRTILDPAVGPGIFPRLLRDCLPSARITCLDTDSVALSAAKETLQDSEIELLQQDFLTWSDERLFDAAVANPPYLRHHDMYYPFDIFQFVGRKNHVGPSRLSNIYLLFILEIGRRLREGGRAAIIVPGEWVNANFGDTLKYWLVSRGLLHTLVYFSHNSTQFDDALTTASILLLEKPAENGGRNSIRTIFVDHDCQIATVWNSVFERTEENSGIVVQNLLPEELLAEKKWNHLLSHGGRVTPNGFVSLSEIADTRRGIATGCNSFFHLTLARAQELGISSQNLIPCIGRALDATGLIFGNKDLDGLVERGARTHLLSVGNTTTQMERAYLRWGESEGINTRYLCSARNGHWYAMEDRPPSPIWATVFGRHGLRFIYNAARIANLTTFHCIYPRTSSREFAPALTACLNSRVVQGLARRQHRVYGGGLLKVEPKDLLDIEVPDLRKVSEKTRMELSGMLSALDDSVRAGGETPIIERLDRVVENAGLEAARN